MSEGKYINGEYVPWTTEYILAAADAEEGPGCCDESYQRLRTIMVVAPDLLEALVHCEMRLTAMVGMSDLCANEIQRSIDVARAAIAKAKGEKQ